ncbi:kynurenine formamidase [Longimonas halophila]|uniref:Kynurenine formamidase n=1 Tax=Longimonas halophila TaxID=1469170 RepID=A0A2H3NTI9_9BACT|nr:cyclase family protein [Longimonas halophila]PEN09536.1 kynurenine formamidase [Longimonas halophila]
MATWIDISQSLHADVAAWPGDVPFSRSTTLSIRDGDSVNCSALQMSAHLGTHADAPYHVDDAGATTSGWNLDTFLGPAEVVAIPPDAAIIRPEHLNETTAPRLLFKTVSSQHPATRWSDAFTAVSVEAVSWMQRHDVCLMGTDAPSVDPSDSTELAAHHALNSANIVNLENLRLGAVEPGRYTLVALPLRVPGADAAPVRAVLHPNPTMLPL